MNRDVSHQESEDGREEQDLVHSPLSTSARGRPWYFQRRRVLLNIYISMLMLANFADGYDGSMMNGLQSLSQWQKSFDHPHGSKLAILAIIQRIGGIAALPFVPYLADARGRRTTIFTGALLMVTGAILQTASKNVGTFIGARFLIGCGSSFSTNGAQMLITEIAHPTQRAPLTSMFNALWQGGAVLAALTTFGSFRIANSWAWRIPSAIQAVPGLIQFFCVFLGPESPRWLISKGMDTEALHNLAYYHADGNEQDFLVRYEFYEIKTAFKMDEELTFGWRTLVGTPGNRKRLMVIIALAFFSQWSGNGLVAYYLAPVFNTIGITDSFTQLLVNSLLSIENLIIATGAALLCDKIGRRKLFITSTAGMLLTFTMQTLFSALYAQRRDSATAHTVVAFIFLFYAFYDIAYSPLVGAYAVEILPYTLRAKGMTVFYFAISLSFVFNQYINPIALERFGWKYYIVFCCWLVFELVFIMLFIVETKNRTLEETAAIFDGHVKVKAITSGAANAYSFEIQDDNREASTGN